MLSVGIKYMIFILYVLENTCCFQGSWPAEYREVEIIKKESPLDPNHSHFILVDNGTQHQYAVEIPFRASLESKIANTKTKNGE